MNSRAPIGIAGLGRLLKAGVLFVTVWLLFVSVSFAAPPELNYRFYCAQCHGLTGVGDGPNATRHQPVAPRNFTSAPEMSALTDAGIILAIGRGGGAVARSTLMPPFASTLTEEEIIELKDYLRRLCRCSGPETP